MIEPVAMEAFFSALAAGAGVIIFGASYAAFLAFGRLQQRRSLLQAAAASYAALAVSVWVLSESLNLTGAWQVITWTMLIGYLLAPHGIWKLCIETHSEESEAHAQAKS